MWKLSVSNLRDILILRDEYGYSYEAIRRVLADKGCQMTRSGIHKGYRRARNVYGIEEDMLVISKETMQYVHKKKVMQESEIVQKIKEAVDSRYIDQIGVYAIKPKSV